MRFGVCCDPRRFEAAAAAGLVYAELPMASLHGKSKEEILQIRRLADGCGISVDGFNCFFGGDVRLYGVPAEEVLSYAAVNFEIANAFGAVYCVVGSGAARRVPAGADGAETEKRFAEILCGIAELARKYGVEIYLEPLCYAETDVINTFEQGLALCRAAGVGNLGCLVDLYHFYKNGEDLSVFDDLEPGDLRHVHLARPDEDRRAPTEADAETLKLWAEKLKASGYDGRVSLECIWGDDFGGEAKTAAKILKEIF